MMFLAYLSGALCGSGAVLIFVADSPPRAYIGMALTLSGVIIPVPFLLNWIF